MPSYPVLSYLHRFSLIILLKLVENDCVNPEKQGYSTTLLCSINGSISSLNPAVVGSLLPDILWLLTWQVVGFPVLSLGKLHGLFLFKSNLFHQLQGIITIHDLPFVSQKSSYSHIHQATLSSSFDINFDSLFVCLFVVLLKSLGY